MPMLIHESLALANWFMHEMHRWIDTHIYSELGISKAMTIAHQVSRFYFLLIFYSTNRLLAIRNTKLNFVELNAAVTKVLDFANYWIWHEEAASVIWVVLLLKFSEPTVTNKVEVVLILSQKLLAAATM
ncbi:unnamed protein product [Tuber aestivum]|uniref:Uncharacterized protein n=1 Tax=Tuber aestivum TaxID=59557 RepID=A0A292PJH5_9PEZI|nr:unnamed protein product [Tuber aestivum]